METTIDISGTNRLLGHVLEYEVATHYTNRTIASVGTTIKIILCAINLEVGEYGGVNAALLGEDEEEREHTLRLPLEGLHALLQCHVYCRNTLYDTLTENESYKEETFEIIS